MPADDLVTQLRSAGCVFAEEEAREIRRVLDDPSAIAAAAAARSRGTPLEHVLERTTFLGLPVYLEDGVFVPRHRTADLVRSAVAAGASSRAGLAVDLGCGCGAVAAALSQRLDEVTVHACDIDPVAVRCARVNGSRYGFSVHEGQWWDALPRSLRGRVDLAVAYLPHVPTDQLGTIPRDFRAHEPTRSVDGGPDGLDSLRSVLDGLDEWLSPEGSFWTLVAPEQVDHAIAEAGHRRVVTEASDDDVIVCVSPAGG